MEIEPVHNPDNPNGPKLANNFNFDEDASLVQENPSIGKYPAK